MSGFSGIEQKLKGVLTSVTRNTLLILATEAERSIDKNFEVGGRPAWKPSKKSKKNKGTKTLVISGALRNVRADVKEAEGLVVVTIDPRARAYAEIQQNGGTIQVKGGKRKMENRKDKRTVFVSSKRKSGFKEVTTKAHTITIPPRPYLVIPPEDFPEIIGRIVSRVKI